MSPTVSMSRLGHLPSTLLGLGGAAAIALQGALGCSGSVTDLQVWLPAVLMAVIGCAIKGPSSVSAISAADVKKAVLITVALPMLVVALAACTSTGAVDPDLGGRLLADVECLTALSGAGIAVATMPSGGAAAVAVMTAIQAAGTSQVPGAVLRACDRTLKNAIQDAQGIKARTRGAPGGDGK